MNPKSKTRRTHPQKIEYAYNSAVSVRWDSDAANGRPSSLDVLLEWLVVPGNAERWCVASGKHDGSQSILASEVYDLLLVHGITYRSRRSVVRKLRWWEEQFDKAESLLRKSGIQQFDDSAEAERMVLRMCPAYPQIASVFRSARQSPEVVSKRVHTRGKSDTMKRSKRVQGNAEQASLRDAEISVRRELYKMELQAKRDEAICVRVTARKDLLELGVSVAEVDRLMPLWESDAQME
ncbi:hypothetical protein PHYSODRAFT_491385 [Phytophthora sojae]|uniref:Uncharacterized protein n=1 Tax=Phytophthora sojae (strain P6497) TaxID=1094619 RepID=G4Z5C6_PHYSP|nr:hypothetical protein PHYSODRAFT_491385 [Phytophthora sojae]EGZ20911.1 hypothetical protein PHYSODRAFT_491385 [Phytophthora sojae]|eukprot:XP_009523628.1 hypothetical protein PHYSODRAFT_491385 [Phytophthora sojae]